MTNYYFLTALLPELEIGKKVEISFQDLKHLFFVNLSDRDLEKVKKVSLYTDIKNLKAFFRSKPLDPKGNLSEKELEEAILLSADLPEYIFDFLQTYMENESRITYFASLFTAFFDDIASKEDGFIFSYFQFEKKCRSILSVLRAKKANKDLVKELQFEDATDPMIAEMLAGKDRPEYDPPADYRKLKEIFDANYLEPKKLLKEYLLFQFQKIEELIEMEVFTIDALLAYLVKWIIVDLWYAIDNNKEFIDVLC